MARKKNSQWNKNLKRIYPEEFKALKSKASFSQKTKDALINLAFKLGFKLPEKKQKPWNKKKEMKAYKRERKKQLQKCKNG